MSFVRTVRGDIAPSELGVCYGHEHLLGAPPFDRAEPDLVLDSEANAVQEMQWFREAGGRGLIEMSTPDYNRDVAGLRRIAEEVDVHIVCATGFNKETFSAPFLKDRTAADLAQQFVREVTDGINETTVRAGVIKASSTFNEMSPLAEKMFKAAAQAHLETGAPISTHTEAGTMALEQVRLLEQEGVEPSHVVIGHMDRRLDWNHHRAVAETGACLSFDQISKEKYDPDHKRIDLILRLVEEGYANQIVLGGDLARRSYWPSYGDWGGPGFTYVLWRFVPWLRKCGLSSDTIETLLIENPARMFAFRDDG